MSSKITKIWTAFTKLEKEFGFSELVLFADFSGHVDLHDDDEMFLEFDDAIEAADIMRKRTERAIRDKQAEPTEDAA